ncbi:MAG: SigB/SigF/SigG family RNA polymerase sigma factor [Streptomyces sp.]|nr:SigB/SigF/SigG family RNA polymerase sigma factor [Streptomyces sp.]
MSPSSAHARRAQPHDEPAGSEEMFDQLRSARTDRERSTLCDRLVMEWLPMSERLARRYRDRGESLDDLRQVAALGLVKAVNRFDPAQGKAFATYAVPTIDGELKRHFRDYSWSVHVPRGVQEARTKVRAVCQEIGDRAPVAAIAARAGLSHDDVRAGLGALHGYSALSLDAPLGPGADGVLEDALGQVDDAYQVVVDREAVRPQVHELPPRERQILFMRFFQDMKQTEIADALGISQMHVSRLLSTTCERLRRAVADDAAQA